jgi:hypothetical protein
MKKNTSLFSIFLGTKLFKIRTEETLQHINPNPLKKLRHTHSDAVAAQITATHWPKDKNSLQYLLSVFHAIQRSS